MEKTKGSIVKATESNNLRKLGAEYPSKQPQGTTLARTIAGWKEGLSQNTKK